MANTTWNPADIATGMVLSNGNLTASNTGNFTGVRAAKGWNAGKYYFEFTVTAMTSGYVGLAKSTTDLTSGGTSGAVGVNGSGSVDVNGVSTGVVIGAISGSLLGIAVDITSNLVWFRSGAAGSWNATSGTANNPVTGVGGISLSAIAGTLFPWFEVVFASSQSVTANFGDSAFSGAVPSGYTAGWPQVAAATSALNTQMLVEEWAASNPAAQLTQLLLEEWMLVPPYGDMRATQVGAEQWGMMIPPQMQATQAAIEQWTSTANVTTRMLATQAAIEQWGPVTSAVTAVTRQAALTVVT
jgi:hypothetical protein